MATVIKKKQNNFLRPAGAFFRQFHLIIFFVFIVSCLSASVLFVNKTLSDSSEAQYTSSINAGTIDQTTLKRIQSHHTSSELAPAPVLPQGRTNPFGE